MKIGEIIQPDHIIVGLRVPDKAQLLRELAARAALALALEPSMIFNALQAREALGSTGLGKGFALPHARLEALRSRFALFARLARPIDFAAIDDRPIDLAVLLLTPADIGSEHLATLAALSRPLRDERLLQLLRQATDAHEVYRLLSQG
jgi:PTS system nitrogen regulatory IIA component